MGLLDTSEPLSTLEHDVYDSEWNHHTQELEIIYGKSNFLKYGDIILHGKERSWQSCHGV